MTKALKNVRTMLLANGDVTGLVSANVFAGILPEHYDPTSNPAVVLTTRGGDMSSETPQANPSIQAAVFAGINQFVLAHTVAQAIVSCLHGRNKVNFGADGLIISCVAESVPTESVDPDNGWAMTMTFFKVMIIATDQGGSGDLITPTQTAKEYIDQQIALLAGIDDNL